MNIETMTRKELTALKKQVDQRIKQIDLESKAAEGVTTLEFLGTDTEMHELKIKSVDRKPEKVVEMFQNWQKAEKWLEPEMKPQIYMGINGPPSTPRKETIDLNPGHYIGLASSIEDIVHADEIDLWKQVVPEVGIQNGSMVSLIYRIKERKLEWNFDYNEFRTIMQKWLPRYVKIFFFTGGKNDPGNYPVIFNPVGTEMFVVMAPRIE
ncbi:hypothetical protein LCGC14_0443960 [marine sediment metagenome]|uniref:Uncharacterized protein n=1 Tax=marine sediment metagenome TaxID=412755 RepID=A0A0F9T2P1_9ZZZZ